MKPLVFLTVRSFVNGVRRAVSSPRRLIGLIVVIGYYFQFFLRPFSPRPTTALPSNLPAHPIAEFNADVLQGGAFAVFAMLSIVLMLGAFNPRGGFRPADVDVLFATPVSPKVVLIFRIVRDYLITLLFPLFIALMSGRSAGPAIFGLLKNFPEQGQIVTRLFTGTYLLMTLCWVCIGYALGMFVNRSDVGSDRNKKIIDRTLLTIFVLTASYIGYRFRMDPSWDTALSLTQNPVLRTIFFTATAATSVIMAPFHGSWLEGIAGVAFMLAIIGISLRIAMTQVEYLYDQAAAKGFQVQDMRNLQRSGDTYGMMAAQAQKGKVRGGWLTRIVGRWRFQGGVALLWKELLLHGRAGLWQYGVFGPVALFMILMPVWASNHRHSESVHATYLGMLGFSVFILSMNNAQSGFIELLRRVDFQKPLPFSPTVTVFWEVAAKAVPSIVIAIMACIGGIVMDVRLWGTAIAGIAMGPSLSLVLAAVALLVMVLFPDVDDAAQRGFRGLMMLLGIAITSIPGIALAIVLMTLVHLPALVVAIPFVLVNLAVAVGVSAIAGGLYASYNPSE